MPIRVFAYQQSNLHIECPFITEVTIYHKHFFFSVYFCGKWKSPCNWLVRIKCTVLGFWKIGHTICHTENPHQENK